MHGRWPVLLQLAKHYGPQRLQLIAANFPLPYHHNAFFASQGAVIVTDLAKNNSKFWDYVQYFFDVQVGTSLLMSLTPLLRRMDSLQ